MAVGLALVPVLPLVVVAVGLLDLPEAVLPDAVSVVFAEVLPVMLPVVV